MSVIDLGGVEMASFGSYTSTSCQILPELAVLSIELWHEVLLGEEIPWLNKEAKNPCTA